MRFLHRALPGLALTLSLLSLGAGDAKKLGKKELKAFERRLSELVHSGEEAPIGELIDELAKRAHPDLVRLILPAATQVPAPDNYDRAVLGLAQQKDPKVLARLEKILSDKKSPILERSLIVDSYGRRTGSGSLARLVKLLGHDHPRLKVAAALALGERVKNPQDTQKAMDALVSQLVEEEGAGRKGRIWAEVKGSLERVTGKRFAGAPDWANWWKTNAASFVPKAGRGQQAAEPAGRTVVGATFFGRELTSLNLLFVIDVSASMMMYDLREDYQGNNPERDLKRLNRAKKQLVQALRGLPKDARFNIIAYSDWVAPWQKKLVKATRGNVAKAVRFVSNLKQGDGTHTGEALHLAYQDPQVDTIVLLSDGAPTRKGFTSSLVLIEKISDWVRRRARTHKIRIDTFGFAGSGKWPRVVPGLKKGQIPPPPPGAGDVDVFVEFLKAIAHTTGGRFQPIK